MYALRTFLVLTLAACSLALPADEPAECAPPTKEKQAEASKCCKIIGYHEKIEGVLRSCADLVKDKPAKGGDKKEGPPPVLKPEGYDCMEDCILTKLGHMTDKKIDADKVLAEAKTLYTNDWAAVGPTFVKKCLDQVSSAEKKDCPTSGADNFSKCIFRESYLNCPTKSWTDSEVCTANKERLQKCPRALPFCLHKAIKEQ